MREDKGYVYDFKDQSPIRFEFFQSDVEKMMYFLEEAIRITGQVNTGVADGLRNIKDDWEHKISIHKERGEWK